MLEVEAVVVSMGARVDGMKETRQCKPKVRNLYESSLCLILYKESMLR